MKKALLLAAAAVATLSFSVDASAHGGGVRGRGLLDLAGETIETGLGPIGVVDQVTALGRRPLNGRVCTYLMEWENPYNPNDVGLCVLEEIRTPLNSSCIENAFVGSGVPTAVLAGDFASDGHFGMDCQGFDLLGIPSDISILASSRGDSVEGVVVIDNFLTLPLQIG